jgi:PadR family transcriptional regulator PadR
MARDSIGEFEQLVLLAVVRLEGLGYGVSILQEIEGRTQRPVSEAAGYLTLRRLEAKGWVTSRLGEPSPERGGRAKRFYEITSDGLVQLRRARANLMSMWSGLDLDWEVSG